MTTVGVIGCDKIAERHLNAYRKLDVEVVVTDVVERGRMIAENYGAAWEPDLNAVIRGDRVDAVEARSSPRSSTTCRRALLRVGTGSVGDRHVAAVDIDEKGQGVRIYAAESTERVALTDKLPSIG